MLRFTRRQVWTLLSTIYLLVLTALAAYGLYSANDLSLPVPNILSALAVALPSLAGLALETSSSMTSARRTNASAHVRPYVLQVVSAFFLIYETVLATLAGTHLAPVGTLDCALFKQWQHLFRIKDEQSVRRIQDRFDCCGYRSPQDMAWPFPQRNAGIDAGACVSRFQRSVACFEPWQEAERRVAGFLLAVALSMFIWQMLFLYIGPEETSWLPSTIRLPSDTANGRRQRQIAYRDDEARDESSIAGAVRILNGDAQFASNIEGGRERATARVQDDDAWVDER
ncbi:hypothetical protein AMS68_003258 [Peltaster fructicola]|uniref:Tetraspanin Tsp3 n=1 Tax=Peltaster fructicola TaxID=286661 RepID=A0A6H0XSV2_9PEZI|nr:hypothetical protein AMS68_003258 [Peltaster fructicola]